MKVKKVPVRMCVACREGRPKRELIRVVKNKENSVHNNFCCDFSSTIFLFDIFVAEDEPQAG